MRGRSNPIVQQELENRLHQTQVLGVSLWRLIRVTVIEGYMTARGAREWSNQNRLPAARIPALLAGILRSLFHLLRLRRSRFLVIGFPRRRLNQGKWVDPFSDPLIDLLGPERVLCMEKPFGGEHFRPSRTRNIIYYDWIMALSLVASSVLFVVPMLVFRREISEVASRADRVTGTSARRIHVLAAKAIVRFWIERSIAHGLLAVVRPQAVLLTLKRQHYPLTCASKLRGIPVYELQHGVIAEGGYKYSAPYDAGLDPDAFLTFGEYWNGSDWGLPAKAVQAIGFKYISDEKRRLGTLSPRRDQVMLVSQPHVSRALGAAFGAIVRRHPEAHFILKLHPQDVGDWASRYPLQTEPNVEVHAKPSSDLYGLFAECNCVIGYDSTVLFEASFFGLKVGILNLEGANPCSALEFAGRYNFREIRDLEQVDDLLRAEPEAGESGDNPFFAAFDEAGFLSLLERGTRSPAPTAEARTSG